MTVYIHISFKLITFHMLKGNKCNGSAGNKIKSVKLVSYYALSPGGPNFASLINLIHLIYEKILLQKLEFKLNFSLESFSKKCWARSILLVYHTRILPLSLINSTPTYSCNYLACQFNSFGIMKKSFLIHIKSVFTSHSICSVNQYICIYVCYVV